MSVQSENVAAMLTDDTRLDTDPFHDSDFDEELFERDPVFTKGFQANLRRMAADMDAQRNVVYHDIIETKS